MNIWHDISPKRIKADDFFAVIEITKGGKAKYEMDKETGLLRLDRVLYTSTHYPANYGFIPRTYANDGDPLDVLVLCSEKIIAIPFDDPTYNNYKDITELPRHIFDEMQHFFTVYKQLEDSTRTQIGEVKDHEAAKAIISSCLERYLNDFCR